MFVCFSWYFQWKKPPRIFLAQKYILLQANRIASVTLPSHPHPTVLGCKLLCFAAPNSSLAIPKGILTDCDRCSWFSHLNNDFCIVGPSTFIRCFEYKTLPWIFVNGKTFGKSRFKKKTGYIYVYIVNAYIHTCIYIYCTYLVIMFLIPSPSKCSGSPDQGASPTKTLLAAA